MPEFNSAVLEKLARDFRSGLQRGESLFIETFLSKVPSNQQDRLLALLIPTEIEFRILQGATVFAEDYQAFGERAIWIAKNALPESNDTNDRKDKTLANQSSKTYSDSAHGREDQLSKVRSIANEFSAQLKIGKRPDIGLVLSAAKHEIRAELAYHLLAIESKHRREKAEEVTAEDYCEQLPFLSPQRVKLAISGLGKKVEVKETRLDRYEGLPRKIDNYVLVEKLGGGGMGDVFLARHHKFQDRKYAVKLLKTNIVRQDLLTRFENEINAAGLLSHPNIVFAFDAGRDGDEPYLVMEYVDGCNTQDLIDSMGPLPIADACEIVFQAAIGLQHAHEKGMTHRDIKPLNIMLSNSGEVKVLDLGLARLREQSFAGGITTEGQFLGTPDYMAPEQWKDSSSVNIQADIYSLGCTLYTFLTGKPPFDSSGTISVMQKMHSHLMKDPSDIRKGSRKIPDGLANVVTKSLEKKPEDRYQEPAELHAALKEFATNSDLTNYAALVREKVQNDEAALAKRAEFDENSRTLDSPVMPGHDSNKTAMVDQKFPDEDSQESPKLDSDQKLSGSIVPDNIGKNTFTADELDGQKTGPGDPDPELEGSIAGLLSSDVGIAGSQVVPQKELQKKELHTKESPEKSSLPFVPIALVVGLLLLVPIGVGIWSLFSGPTNDSVVSNGDDGKKTPVTIDDDNNTDPKTDPKKNTKQEKKDKGQTPAKTAATPVDFPIEFQGGLNDVNIFVDDLATPIDANGKIKIKPGPHSLKFVKKGFVFSNPVTINVSSSDNKPLVVIALPLFAVKVEFSQPVDDVDVRVNGQIEKLNDQSELELVGGQYDLTFSAKDFLLESKTGFTIGPETKLVNVNATRLIPVRFKFSRAVEDVELLIDDELSTLDIGNEFVLPEGKHKFLFRSKDYQFEALEEVMISAQTKTIDVKALKIIPVQFQLKPDGKDVVIFEAGQAIPREKDGSYRLIEGMRNLTFKKEGFATFTKSLEISDSSKPFPIELKKNSLLLPKGFVATEGSKVDPKSGLPTRIVYKGLDLVEPLEFVLILPQEFEYGVPSGITLLEGELKAKTAAVSKPFYVAVNETSYRQFESFANRAGEEVAGTFWKKKIADTASLPVTGVTRSQATAFCKSIGGVLPSEIEWELAARSPTGDSFPFPWKGKLLTAAHANLTHGEQSQLSKIKVAAKGLSPLGISDLIGNVAEWCREEYTPGFNESAEDALIAKKGVVRGRGFYDLPEDARVTSRVPIAPEPNSKDELGDIGFRVFILIE